MTMGVVGKTNLITGGSGGIGAPAAGLFAAEGAQGVLGARRGGELRGRGDEIGRGLSLRHI